MSIVHQLRLEFDAKACNRCGKVKPLTEFSKQKSLPGGHKHSCKACCKAMDAARYVARNVGNRQAYNRAYYTEHSGAIKARVLRNYHADPEPVKQRVLGWNRAHGEQRRVYNMRLRHRNPEMHRERWRRRHARKMATQVTRITTAQLKAKCEYWGNRCWICGGAQEAIDHVKPLNKGGAHILCNLRPICRACNTRKLDKWPYPTRSYLA